MLKYRCVNVNVIMKVTLGFCKRLATGRCYSGIDTGHFKDHRSSTTANPRQDEIRKADAVQPRFVVGNNADLIECGLGRDSVVMYSGLEMMGVGRMLTEG